MSFGCPTGIPVLADPPTRTCKQLRAMQQQGRRLAFHLFLFWSLPEAHEQNFKYAVVLVCVKKCSMR